VVIVMVMEMEMLVRIMATGMEMASSTKITH